ncbi:hypothetical protein [Microbacterium terricola]|uniref:Serine-threonine protein kinase n=1 Tax=Microbacterium terricola TaxID=344163 RepID=A0ABM8DYS7_9MICO|nr:hypothetical protein [Microbacterium terricola]UYK41503.1 hypothetical protein OAU46_07720 [Microbacterium terricola]BDV30706.1 hypothetical protein Microterr_13660 [Microbacterium terricola]
MALRRIPGSSQQYFLIAYDKRGDEVRDPDGTVASAEAIAALTDAAAAVTDVFILSHGWQGDYDDAISQYDRWIGAADPDTEGDGIRPFVIGLHWPSKAWSDRELKGAPSGLLGDEPAADGDAITVDEAVDEYAAQLGDSPEVRAALSTVLAYAAEVDPGQDATDEDALPADVADAYRVIAAATAADDGDEPLLGGGWDPDAAFQTAAEAQPDDGLLGDGWFRKLREAVLTPLRQLTFWHGKNQAREFGERGAARLVRAVMDATPARVHLLGHSFGTIVVSGAVRGPGDVPPPPPRPVDSLFLVQGAVSLWAFAESVPESIGRGRGYFADVVTPRFVSGPILVTRSRWDHAVGRFYPLAVRLAGQFLLGDDLPKYGGIGTFGAQGVEGAVELPPLRPGSRPADHFAAGTVHNIEASEVIAELQGASGAHNDLAHAELVRLAWSVATSRAD